MNVLELFSGTKSVGKVCKDKGFNVISLDIKNADINCDILDWDYKIYLPNHFNYIHASPPCDTFSNLRKSNYGKPLKAHNPDWKNDKSVIFTKELFLQDQLTKGLPILNKTLEIIEYFNPQYYTIENPKSSDMKKYITELPFTDVDYCRYGFLYKKPTRIWNNFEFIGEKCNHKTHSHSIGHAVKNNNLKKDLPSNFGNVGKMNEKYKMPPLLIEAWINKMISRE